jgi:hypothetical protein
LPKPEAAFSTKLIDRKVALKMKFAVVPLMIAIALPALAADNPIFQVRAALWISLTPSSSQEGHVAGECKSQALCFRKNRLMHD